MADTLFAFISIETRIFLKKVENIFNPYPIVFKGINLKVRKNLAFLLK
jgi:hypothetical protein